MKKKILLIITFIMIVFITTGCNKKTIDDQPIEVVSNDNSVVVYFSATGTTKNIAQRISSKLNSDIIEIIPKEKYTTDDLNYNNDCRANREQNDSNSRPEIENTIDVSKYDTIYLGYPIWWGTNPKIILTFLDTYDLKNKTIIPFCTSGSSGITTSVNELRNYNQSLNIKDGKRFSLSDSDDEIISFIGKTNEVISSVKILIDNNEYNIELENNETARDLVNILPLEFNMNELNGNEKYIYLDNKLKSNATNPKRINAGDVMLYGDDCLVIFYKSFDTSYSYTKIGHINNLPDLGSGSISVKIEKN